MRKGVACIYQLFSSTGDLHCFFTTSTVLPIFATTNVAYCIYQHFSSTDVLNSTVLLFVGPLPVIHIYDDDDDDDNSDKGNEIFFDDTTHHPLPWSL